MGGGDGAGYKYPLRLPKNNSRPESNGQESEPPENLSENLSETVKFFPIAESGYFGEPSNSKVRRIYVADPDEAADQFFRLLGARGEEVPMTNGKGTKLIMKDGSYVQLRPNSKSKGPAIDITSTSPEIKDQKIHFLDLRSKK